MTSPATNNFQFSRSKYLHRGQFIFLPGEMNISLSWNQYSVSKKYKLLTHPEVKVQQLQSHEEEILILGRAFKMEGQLEDLLGYTFEGPAFYRILDSLTGVFLVICYHKKSGKIRFFPDNGALMEAYFYRSGHTFLAGSQCKLLKRVIEKSAFSRSSSKEQFFKSPIFQKNKILPLYLRPYEQVQKLVPNHFYDLDSDEMVRYFPYENRGKRSPEELVDIIYTHLNWILPILFKTEKVAIPLTAGWDSRLILSVAQKQPASPLIYTRTRSFSNLKHPDVAIPFQISKRLNLTYSAILDSPGSPEGWKEVFQESIDDPRIQYNGRKLNFSSSHPLMNILVLHGTVIETTKNYYGPIRTVSPQLLAKLFKYKGNPVVLSSYDQWIQQTRGIAKTHNYPMIDLFHWEQNIGGSVSKGITEGLITGLKGVFPPYNCKQLITNLLSVPQKYRGNYNNKVFQRYIEKYAPEIKDIPVNPGLKQSLLHTFENTRLYRLYKEHFHYF